MLLTYLKRRGSFLLVPLVFTTVVISFAFFGTGCGSTTSDFGGTKASINSDDDADPDPDVNLDYESKYKTVWHDFLKTEHYSGYISVMFRKGLDFRLENGELTSAIDQSLAHSISETVRYHGGNLSRGVSVSADIVEEALEKAKREGIELNDWNLYYTIKIKSPGHAEDLFVELSKSKAVDWVEPQSVLYVNEGGNPTPDITGDQSYIKSHKEAGGLNIQAAWDLGIKGQDVRILDVEYNWNFDHEDLPIKDGKMEQGGDIFWIDSDLPNFVNDQDVIDHGTAVAGILTAKDNGLGITGIAHKSTLKLFRVGNDKTTPINIVSGLLEFYTGQDLGHPTFRPGDIIMYEVGSKGPNAGAGKGCDAGTGCLPIESYTAAFKSIEDITKLGYIVVEGASNGGLDLNSPDSFPPSSNCEGGKCPDLSKDNSGAIMVGASHGGTNDGKLTTSNCGNRVEVYAWGGNVTTTGYGYDIVDNKVVPNSKSDPNNKNKWYTNSFRGTSSATALVAGSAALIQSFVKDFYSKLVPHKKVYLQPKEMKELLVKTGINAAGGEKCSIGVKPDVGAAIAAIQNGDYLPKVAPDTGVLIAHKNAVSGIRYDMDRDGRAELISYDDGIWQIDLSTIAPNIKNPNPDNYGEWDISINLNDMVSDGIYYPVVHDYDSDGDADLAIYDSKNGIWYIKFTTPDIIPPLGKGGQGGILQLDWDLEIDYSNDQMWKPYGRPLPGDYNGDNYLDLAIFKPDGWLVIDYGGIGRVEKKNGKIEYVSDFGGLEKKAKILTDEQLKAAPGWAYHVAVGGYGLLYRIPDGVNNAEQYATVTFKQSNKDESILDADVSLNKYHKYGGNELSFAAGFWLYSYGAGNDWKIITNLGYYLVDLPKLNFDSSDYCLPVPADYDGDGKTDFALKCSDGWRIAYYENQGGYPPKYIKKAERVVSISDGNGSLPATIYSGGISYQYMKGLLDHDNLFGYYKDKDPFTPHTVECINFWAPPPTYCMAK